MKKSELDRCIEYMNKQQKLLGPTFADFPDWDKMAIMEAISNQLHRLKGLEK